MSKKVKKSIKTALYAGSFDPFTIGHEDIVNRALKIFDHLTIVIAISPTKEPLFSDEQRFKMIKDHFCYNVLVIDCF